ncbi:hypothetical protein Hanom_Chr09g00812701 [Helianthus anomalus]
MTHGYSSQIVVFTFTNSKCRLGNIFGELAVTFYRDEGRKVKTRLEKKSYGSIEFNVRYCFKVAIYAEFRRDWAEALRMYEDGYHALREVRFPKRLNKGVFGCKFCFESDYHEI